MKPTMDQDLRTECLSDEVEIEIESQVDISGGHHGSGSGSGDHETHHGSGSGSGDHESGSGSAPAIELVGGAGPLEGNLTTGSHFGKVSEDFGRDNVQCNGTEDYIW